VKGFVWTWWEEAIWIQTMPKVQKARKVELMLAEVTTVDEAVAEVEGLQAAAELEECLVSATCAVS